MSTIRERIIFSESAVVHDTEWKSRAIFIVPFRLCDNIIHRDVLDAYTRVCNVSFFKIVSLPWWRATGKGEENGRRREWRRKNIAFWFTEFGVLSRWDAFIPCTYRDFKINVSNYMFFICFKTFFVFIKDSICINFNQWMTIRSTYLKASYIVLDGFLNEQYTKDCMY